jgi:hypothetical protein
MKKSWTSGVAGLRQARERGSNQRREKNIDFTSGQRSNALYDLVEGRNFPVKLPIAPLSLLALCLLLAAVPAVAQQDIYDNGPGNGQDLGWTVNFGFSVTDNFTLSNPNAVDGVSFWAWLIPGDTLTSVELQFGSAAFGNDLFDQTVNLTQSRCFSNQFGYNVCDETAMINAVNLNSGSYWMTLSNAMVPSGDPAYWDMNSGPSAAQENTLGTIPSESFTILGGETTSTTGTTTGTTPEPSSILLLGSGILGVAGLRRRR